MRKAGDQFWTPRALAYGIEDFSVLHWPKTLAGLAARGLIERKNISGGQERPRWAYRGPKTARKRRSRHVL